MSSFPHIVKNRPCRICHEFDAGPFDSKYGHPVAYYTKLGFDAGVAHPECVVDRSTKRLGRRFGEGLYIARDSPYSTFLR